LWYYQYSAARVAPEKPVFPTGCRYTFLREGYSGGTKMSNNKDKDLKDPNSIYSKGYGLVAKSILLDRHITLEAKGIYAYLCSYAGSGNEAYPAVDKICFDLNIAKNRFYRHIPQLIQAGYIKVESNKPKGQFSNNIYTIVAHLDTEGSTV
jgi:hypothetical protein